MKLLTLTFVCAFSFFGQQPSANSTAGLNNGYIWEKGNAATKQIYVTGIGDGVFLQAIVTATKTGRPEPDQTLYPQGFLITDLVQGIDAFYTDRTNIKVPILFAYLYVMTKIRGASQEELDAMAARYRRLANQ